MYNVEIKARTNQQDKIKSILEAQNARYVGMDHQIDTYFNVNEGRLKLREGNIEQNLIQYNRPNQAGPKRSEVVLYKSEPNSTLKEALSNACGVLTVVNKKRHIYFIDHTKFHLDIVEKLGTFVEIEVIDRTGLKDEQELLKICQKFMALFGISSSDLIDRSYSDLLIEAEQNH